MKNKIIELIIKVSYDNTIKENPEIDLIETGVLDSLAFINLISELQDEFDIEIQPTQIPSDTWRFIDSIVKLVESKISETNN